jgi:hypothetical protein
MAEEDGDPARRGEPLADEEGGHVRGGGSPWPRRKWTMSEE